MIEKYLMILSNENVAQDIFLLRLLSPELSAGAVPGQFLMVRVNDSIDPVLRRPFSICGTEEEGIVKILYKVIGRGTEFLSMKKAGEHISILGPLGKGFRIHHGPNNSILVAGGIGIAPLLFLSHYIDSTETNLLTGFRTSREIVDPVLTGNNIVSEIATDDGTMGFKGVVTDMLYKKLEKNIFKETRIYACGPLPMLKSVARISSEFKIPCQVSMETFMACGLGVCQGCVVRYDTSKNEVPYLHVCKEGPVFDINEIDWDNV